MSDNLRIGIIGGTGLGEALGAEAGLVECPDTPFGKPSSPIVLTRWEGVEIAILQRHGPGHVFPPSLVPARANVYALKLLGVTHVIASGATGSLREEIRPGDLVIADQVIDKTHRRPSTFYEHAAVHVELSEPFCPVMRQWLLAAARRIGHIAGAEGQDVQGGASGGSVGSGGAGGAGRAGGAGGSGGLPRQEDGIRVHPRGTYVCMEGPAFSTKAESHLHRAWGGDLIGMTAMPEAKLAREAELAYALIALPTDYDCWRPHAAGLGMPELLKEIIGNLQRATANSVALLQAALADVTLLRTHPSPAHEALKLAIWSDKKKIDPAEVERLRPLWGRYF